MKYSHLVHHDPEHDKPAVCARCGAAIAWEHVVEQDGELVSYGSTCVKVVLGQQLEAEEAQRRVSERERRDERIRRRLAPTAEEVRSAAIGALIGEYFDALLAGDDAGKAEIMAELEKLGYVPKEA